MELFTGLVDSIFEATIRRSVSRSMEPRDGKKLAEIPLANSADVDAAYQAAAKAFKSWSKHPGTERGKIPLNNRRYRFGASALFNDLLRQLETQRTGAYQAPWTFSEDSRGY